MLPDVINRLEDEKKQLSDLEARYEFAGEVDVSLKVSNNQYNYDLFDDESEQRYLSCFVG